jgi:hypothetical protein
LILSISNFGMSPKKGVKRRRRTKKNEFGETGDNDTSAQSYMYVQIVYMHNKAWKRVVVVILYFRITGSRTQPKQLNKK